MFLTKSALLFGGVLVVNVVSGQPAGPVQWRFTAVPLGENEVKLVFTATLDEGWHIYAQHLEAGGPLPTRFTLERGDYKLQEEIKEESEPVKVYDHTFMMDIIWFCNVAVFTQQVKLTLPETIIRGKVEFMVGTKDMCLPPQELKFSIPVNVRTASTRRGR